MAISTPKLIGVIGVLVLSLALVAYLLISSIIPQYSVEELFEDNDPESMIGKRMQLVGDVEVIGNNSTFTIIDWSGLNHTINVSHSNVPLPGGFGIGKRVLVDGKLQFNNGEWSLEANQISTKCPSKYNTEGN
jgi:cytochrome c-type biogenesis protein CcmE